MVLASDGDANVGQTDPKASHRDPRRRRGHRAHRPGFGMGNYKDARMEELADNGDGNYGYIDYEDEARRCSATGCRPW